jgi:hypothetical protein
MTNQISNDEMYRNELETLNEIQSLDVSPATRKAIHDRILVVAFKLQRV